ncbi:MAG: ABC transporter permease [Bdellovibrionales bacterium]|nr:ABC transporter permease [Bdellovibrionales bacterium]MCB0417866.1 ABC transporter permease [Bdellovibrionales bacterium]
MKKLFDALKGPVAGVLLSLAVCAGLLAILGESPYVLLEALQGTLFTSFGLGYTLFYATPLIFTGLAVAVCFHCGLFNIGAEGQLYLGSVGIVIIGSLFPNLPGVIALVVGIAAAFLFGGFWGGLAGFLKAKRGSHEVIVTILLNFIGIALVNYLILYPLRNQTVQNPETVEVSSTYFLPTLFDSMGLFESTPVNLALFLAVLTALAAFFFLFRTAWGYELRAVGASNRASEFAGISVSRNMMLAMFLGGGLAGMVGINEVMGHQHKLVEGFSPQYGFTGIAVALLARNHPIGILLSAVLFGALHNSAREIEFLSDKVSKELSLVLQALIIAFVASHYLFENTLKRRKKETT